MNLSALDSFWSTEEVAAEISSVYVGRRRGVGGAVSVAVAEAMMSAYADVEWLASVDEMMSAASAVGLVAWPL